MRRALFLAAMLLTALPPVIASAATAQSNLAITVTSNRNPGSDPTVGLLPPDRDAYANWSNAGLLSVGDIPNRTTVCATVKPIGSGADDTSNINNAIAMCPAGRVLSLGAGTFTIAEGNYVLLNKGVTLRGAGAGSTILQRTNGAQLQPGQPYGSHASPIVVIGPEEFGQNWNVDGTNSPSTSVNLTADGVQGSISVRLNCGGDCATRFSVGQIILIDALGNEGWLPDPTGASTSVWAAANYRVVWQKHNPSLPQDDFTASQYPTQPGTRGDGYSRLDRVTNELKQIQSISGNTITFNSPLTTAYLVSNTAQVTWVSQTGNGPIAIPFLQYAGLENLSVSNGDDSNIKFVTCAYCWGRNIESSIWNGRGINFIDCFRCELREFYAHDAAYSRPGGGAYAIALTSFSTEVLIEDGISAKTNKVIVAESAGAGSVVSYNYMDDGFIDYNENWIEIGLNGSHMAGSHHILFEGNYAFNMDSDNTHGPSEYMTYFRNWSRGVRHPFVNPQTGHTVNDFTQSGNGPQRTGATNAYSYWFTFIGNVLGASGQISGWTYQGDLTSGPAIWAPGWGESDMNGTWHTDPQVINSTFSGHLIREGNWDWLTSSQIWDTGITPVTISNSFYLTSAPDFFGANPWPWVNPAIGATTTLPAQARWLACQSSSAPTFSLPTASCIFSH